jgi:hypothetical protein
MMRVKVPPIWGDVTPNLPTPSKPGILQSEAGNRAQSGIKQIGSLALKGKQVLKKCLIQKPQSEFKCELDSLHPRSVFNMTRASLRRE